MRTLLRGLAGLVLAAAVAAPAHAEDVDLRDEIDAALIELPAAGRLEREDGDLFAIGGPCDVPDPWTLELGLGFSLARGNSDLLTFTIDGKAIYEKGPWLVGNRIQFVYGETDSVRSAENWRTKHRVDRKLSQRTYAFFQLIFDRDELANLEYRFSPTVGVGRTLDEGPRGFLKVEVGGGGVIEKRLGLAQTTSPSAYFGVDFERNWADGKKITIDYDFIANINDVDLSFWNLDVAFAVPVCSWIDMTAGVRLDYVFNPPGSVKQLDVLVVVGLIARFDDI